MKRKMVVANVYATGNGFNVVLTDEIHKRQTNIYITEDEQKQLNFKVDDVATLTLTKHESKEHKGTSAYPLY